MIHDNIEKVNRIYMIKTMVMSIIKSHLQGIIIIIRVGLKKIKIIQMHGLKPKDSH